jgi:hypothetical protein
MAPRGFFFQLFFFFFLEYCWLWKMSVQNQAPKDHSGWHTVNNSMLVLEILVRNQPPKDHSAWPQPVHDSIAAGSGKYRYGIKHKTFWPGALLMILCRFWKW